MLVQSEERVDMDGEGQMRWAACSLLGSVEKKRSQGLNARFLPNGY